MQDFRGSERRRLGSLRQTQIGHVLHRWRKRTPSYAAGIQLLGQVALGIIGTAYVVGLLVVNIRLARYGMYGAGLLKVEYILCGFLWLTLLALAVASWNYFRDQLDHLLEAYGGCSKSMYLMLLLVAIASVIGTWLVILHLLTGKSEGELYANATITFVVMIITAAQIKAIVKYASEVQTAVRMRRLTEHRIRPRIKAAENAVRFGPRVLDDVDDLSAWTRERERRMSLYGALLRVQRRPFRVSVYAILSSALLCVLLLTVYALYVYPRIEKGLGGGRAERVVLVLKDSSSPVFNNLQDIRTGRLVGPLELLSRDGDSTFVLARQGEWDHVARISNSDISAVVLPPSRR